MNALNSEEVPSATAIIWKRFLGREGWLASHGIHFVGVVVAVALWWLLTLGAEGSIAAFRPATSIAALTELVANERFWQSLRETMWRLFVGLAIATIVGVPIGVLTGYSKVTNGLTYVSFQVLRMVSPLSWTPVAIILFGLGSEPVYFLVAIAAVWPVIINTSAGVHATDQEWLEVARCLGAGQLKLLRYIYVRAALPNVVLGIRLALGVAWIVIVPAEMLGVTSGLGYMILDFRDVNDYASIMALIVIIGVLGIVLDIPLRRLIEYLSAH